MTAPRSKARLEAAAAAAEPAEAAAEPAAAEAVATEAAAATPAVATEAATEATPEAAEEPEAETEAEPVEKPKPRNVLPRAPSIFDADFASSERTRSVRRRTKHIMRATHYLRDLVARRFFVPRHIAGTSNPADVFTKALSASCCIRGSGALAR